MDMTRTLFEDLTDTSATDLRPLTNMWTSKPEDWDSEFANADIPDEAFEGISPPPPMSEEMQKRIEAFKNPLPEGKIR